MHRVRAILASVAVAAALLAVPSLVSAAIPTGSFEIQFGGQQSIWMGEEGIAAGEEFCTGFEASFDDLEFCDFQAFVDGKGRIYGYLEFSGWSGGLHIAEGGPIKGIQRGHDRSGVSRVDLTISLAGIASDGLATAPTRSGIRLRGQTTADGFVSGVWIMRVCIKGLGCNQSERPAPPTVLTNGGWSLELEITDAGGGELGGGARVEFGDGSDCYYTVDGRYNARKDTAGLRLFPTEAACAGTSLKLRDVRLMIGPPDDIAGSIDYQLFGFRGATPFGVLPLARLLALPGRSANQPLFAFVCSGTLAIAASVDPSACSWTVSINPDDLAARQWRVLEELLRARVPGGGPGASFGRRSFVFIGEQAIDRGGRGAVLISSGAGLEINVIQPPAALETRALLMERAP
jgi:hypothetical protein